MATASIHRILILTMVIVLCIFSNCIFAETTYQQPQGIPPSSEKESLDIQKLKLEIQKTEQEMRSVNLQSLLQAGTLLAALLAATISFWSAWKTQKSQVATLTAQNRQQQQARISDLLKELGSEHLAVRIAAIQALSEYKSTAPFLVNILRVDKDPRVVSATLTALRTMPEISLTLLADASRTLHDQKMQVVSELICLGMTKGEAANTLLLDPKLLDKWTQDTRFRRVKESLETKLTTLLKAGRGTEDDIRSSERRRNYDDWVSLHDAFDVLLNATERIIEYAAGKEQSYDMKKAYLQGIILDGINLSGWNFEGADLRGASLRDTICQQTNFSGTVLASACFQNAQLHDANFDVAILDKTDFGRATLHRASFIGSIGQLTVFQGAKLQNSNLQKSQFVEGQFQGAFAKRVNFKDSILFRSNFILGVFSDADFSGANLSGARLEKIRASRAKFIKTTFAGSNLSHGRFIKADFNEASFKGITQFNSSFIVGAHFENSIWGEKTEEFQQYIKEHGQGNSQNDDGKTQPNNSFNRTRN
jgi:uncharacterized protein YjbI with pentapeptide repeats